MLLQPHKAKAVVANACEKSMQPEHESFAITGFRIFIETQDAESISIGRCCLCLCFQKLAKEPPFCFFVWISEGNNAICGVVFLNGEAAGMVKDWNGVALQIKWQILNLWLSRLAFI